MKSSMTTSKNYKRHAIPKAQLVIADIYNIGKNAPTAQIRHGMRAATARMGKQAGQ